MLDNVKHYFSHVFVDRCAFYSHSFFRFFNSQTSRTGILAIYLGLDVSRDLGDARRLRRHWLRRWLRTIEQVNAARR
jgi:hypothetical protein